MRSLKKQGGWVGAAIAAGASLLGGSKANRAASAQALRAQQASAAEAAIQRDFTSAQSLRQMTFQERMSSTAHRREQRDLRKAGLNPILSVTGGPGASSPGGASGSGGQGSGFQAQQRDVITPAVTSAISYRRANAEIKSIEAQTKFTESKTQIATPFKDIGKGIGAVTTPLAEKFQSVVTQLPAMPSSAKEAARVTKTITKYLKGEYSGITGKKTFNKYQEWWFRYRHRNLPQIHRSN